MVRLVFRPYTQIRRSICTSESLRASTRVSSGFTLFRHSSPSFGSQHARSTADPSQKVWSGRRCPSRRRSQLSLSLRARVFHPNTRGHVRLLGPCFKTGRLKPLRQHPKHVAWAEAPTHPEGARAEFLNLTPRMRQKTITHPQRCHLSLAIIRGTKLMLTRRPRNTPSRSEAESRRTRLTSSVSLSTISRTVSLSFQSAFHLSLTVLVRYRSLANI